MSFAMLEEDAVTKRPVRPQLAYRLYFLSWISCVAACLLRSDFWCLECDTVEQMHFCLVAEALNMTSVFRPSGHDILPFFFDTNGHHMLS